MEDAYEDDEGPLMVDCDDHVMRECAVCKSIVVWEGDDAPVAHAVALAKNGRDLCERCAHARVHGSYAYVCSACDDAVTGSEAEVIDCLNVGDGGHVWCRSCRSSYFGVWSEANLAISIVASAIAAGTPSRSDKANTQRQQARLYEDEVKYKKVVREMSHAAAKREPERVNPRRLVKGHLDHIVPVVVCFDHRVPEAVAASIENLVIIPKLVNIAKGANFTAEEMIGHPAFARPA